MPIYNYSCRSCKHEFDKFLSVANYKQPESENCPNCDKLEVQKIISPPNMFQFDKNIKTDDTFRDLLTQIGKNNKHSNIDPTFGGS